MYKSMVGKKSFVVVSVVFALLLVLTIYLISAGDFMALQGNVNQGTSALASGNVVVTIWDAQTGGNLIYNSTTDFNNAIVSGKYDVLLGNGTNQLNLELGKKYYLEVFVNNEQFT